MDKSLRHKKKERLGRDREKKMEEIGNKKNHIQKQKSQQFIQRYKKKKLNINFIQTNINRN